MALDLHPCDDDPPMPPDDDFDNDDDHDDKRNIWESVGLTNASEPTEKHAPGVRRTRMVLEPLPKIPWDAYDHRSGNSVDKVVREYGSTFFDFPFDWG
jgi:hypothetical protein